MQEKQEYAEHLTFLQANTEWLWFILWDSLKERKDFRLEHLNQQLLHMPLACAHPTAPLDYSILCLAGHLMVAAMMRSHDQSILAISESMKRK